jgi:hypothetical protein
VTEERRVVKLAVGGGAVVPLPRPRPEQDRPLLAEEQLAYARWLDGGMKAGLLVLVVTFALYVAGVLTPHLPVEDLPRYWSMPVKDYLAATGIHAGWSWVLMLGKGDFLNFVGIAFLSGVTIACYLVVVPIFFRKKDRVYGWLAVVEVLVLTLAASGLLKSGGH